MLVQRKRSVQTTGSRLNQDDDAGPHGEGDVAYAGLVTRTIAIVVDVLLIDAAALAVTGAALLVGSVFSISTKHHEAVWAVIGGATFVLWVIVYFVGFWTTTGQTPGNRLMHISVVRPDRKRLRPRQALVRLGAMLLSVPLLWGYWPILISARRRGVPDRLAGTVVIVADDDGQTGTASR